jgi:hypothetical protein
LFIFFRNKQTVFLTLYLSFSFSLTVVNASLEMQVKNNETHQIERYIGKKTKKIIFHRSIKDIWPFLSFKIIIYNEQPKIRFFKRNDEGERGRV